MALQKKRRMEAELEMVLDAQSRLKQQVETLEKGERNLKLIQSKIEMIKSQSRKK